jgi:membrane fusion protein, multidrug efflux system
MTEQSPKNPRIAVGIAVGTAFAILAGGLMLWHAESKVNNVALASSPKNVSYVHAKQAVYRNARFYVGSLRPWVEANVGPQFISAYVDTVLVRPGSVVKRGEVLATLDCRNASAEFNAIAMQARAIEARQKAIADEASRTETLLHGGFASANETEQALSQSTAEAARLEAQKAQLAHSNLEVRDCILRAPFDGEVGDRFIDPGAFARPGTPIVSLVDRSTVRFTADVPEADFSVVSPSTLVGIHIDASMQDVNGVIARRAPHADAEVRTIHFEVDLPNHDRSIPVDTTGEARIEFGDPVAAAEIPLYAATVRSHQATIFVVDGGIAHARTVKVLGETATSLLLDAEVAPGTLVVTEGRTLLIDGDRVAAKEEPSLTADQPKHVPSGAEGPAPKAKAGAVP